MKEIEQEDILSKGLLLLMAFAVCATAANMYYNQPLLPLIGEKLNLNEGALGLIPFASQIGYAVAIMFISPLGDIMERKQLIGYLSIILVLALLAVYLSTNIWLIICATFFIGIGANITQQIIPFASSLSKPENKSKTISTLMSGLGIGVLLSRTISGMIAERYSWQIVFLVAAIVASLIGSMLYAFLPKIKPKASLSYSNLLKSMITLIKTQPLLRESALTGTLWFALFNAFWATIAIHITDPPFNYTVEQAGFFGFIGMSGIIGAKISGGLSGRFGPNVIITAGLLFVLSSFGVLMIWGNSLAGLIIGTILLDIGVFGSQVSNQVRVFSIDPKAQSRMNAVYMLCYYIGASLGSVIGVKIIADMGWIGLTIFGSALAVVALIYHLIKNH